MDNLTSANNKSVTIIARDERWSMESVTGKMIYAPCLTSAKLILHALRRGVPIFNRRFQRVG